VSKKVAADMFGLSLRTYRRKIQRTTESATERGRSLWEAVLDFVKAKGPVKRREVLERFSHDDEGQVRSVLRDLCESELVLASGSGLQTEFRAASDEEFAAVQRRRGSEGMDEMLVALMYRDGPLSLREMAGWVQVDPGALEPALARLASAGRIEEITENGETLFRASSLVIPLGAPVGFEAAVFDHFKALVTTVIRRVGSSGAAAEGSPRVGGSTYTIDLWDGHPLADEVFGTLGRLRTELTQLRQRVLDYDQQAPVTAPPSRVVIYVGQNVTAEDDEPTE
jgi:DNA-binding MarR family transcriptional regulator